jgi:hypothetical protein
MASIIVTKGILNAPVGGTILDAANFEVALRDGMIEFGSKFAELYANGKDEDALFDTFKHIFDQPVSSNYGVFAISAPKAGSAAKVHVLINASYNDDTQTISFGTAGPVTRRFKMEIRRDRKFAMNVSMPFFDDPLSYLQGVARQVKTVTDAQAAKFLLANSLISRCK